MAGNDDRKTNNMSPNKTLVYRFEQLWDFHVKLENRNFWMFVARVQRNRVGVCAAFSLSVENLTCAKAGSRLTCV